MDALAAGNLAITGRAPLLLTPTDKLPDVTRDALADVLATDAVFVAGGTEAVSAEVEGSLDAEGYVTTRLFGSERYATTAAFVTEALAQGADADPAFLASGTNFPDALTAVPAAHALGGITLLVDPSALKNSAATVDLLTEQLASLRTVYVAGGVEAISDRVLDQVTALLSTD